MLMQNYSRYPISFVKGEGAYLFDDKGEKYLDFTCGISVTNLGHSHPKVSEAVSKQASTLMHTSNLYEISLQKELASEIIKHSFEGSVFFCNSGAEANEAAIKLARLYGYHKHHSKRYKVISAYNAFHGRTYATMGATAQEKIQKGFTPMPSYNSYVPYNDIQALKAALSLNDVCAIILEFFQGEGGVVPIDKAYIKEVRRLCDEQDILLIIDEVQTGYGRTGELFAYKLFDIEPDIMTLAKSIANGIPMGACVAKNKAAELFTAGTHGSTFGGNFLACAAALAVIKEMTAAGFLKSVKEKGEKLRKHLEANLPKGFILRGEGLLLGVQAPSHIINSDIIKKCINEHLLLIPAGNNAVRVYPPLNIPDEDLIKGADIFISVAKSFN